MTEPISSSLSTPIDDPRAHQAPEALACMPPEDEAAPPPAPPAAAPPPAGTQALVSAYGKPAASSCALEGLKATATCAGAVAAASVGASSGPADLIIAGVGGAMCGLAYVDYYRCLRP